MKKYLIHSVRILVISLLVLTLTSSQSNAQEKVISTDSRTDLTVSIYNDNLALIKDTRNILLTKGINKISFLDVSGSIIPESALVNGSKLSVAEQNFNYDLLTSANLFAKAIGEKVIVRDTNPATGDAYEKEAVLLNTLYNDIVLRIGDKIETFNPNLNKNRNIIFTSLPKNLRTRPTLVLTLNSGEEKERPVELSYLSSNLSWKADYVAELNSKEDAFSLVGLVTLTNNSGVAYENTNLQLIAGNINRAYQPVVHRNMKAEMGMDMLANSAKPAVSTENFAEYYLYTLNGKTTIESAQTKQVTLLSSDKVSSRKEFKFSELIPNYETSSYEFKKINPSYSLTFKNDDNSGLGMALPAGVFRTYKSDSKGKMLFVGEDNIRHTAKNDEVTINLGSAFDISASGKLMEYKKIATKESEATYKIIFKNAKKEKVNVLYHQNFYNEWTIISESIKSKKDSQSLNIWSIPIAAEGETILEFKVNTKSR